MFTRIASKHDSLHTRSLATTFISGIWGSRNKLTSEVMLCTSVERKKEKKKRKNTRADVRQEHFIERGNISEVILLTDVRSFLELLNCIVS